MTDLAPAPYDLAAAAAKMRGWDLQETLDAIMAAGHANWTFEAVFREWARLVLAEDGEPADLRNSARRARVPAGDSVPDQCRPGGAEYLAALGEVRAKAARDARRLGHSTGEIPALDE
jgi:hypothetical protein